MHNKDVPQVHSSEASRTLYKLILQSQQPRHDLNDIGVFQLIDELDRLRQCWKNAEESRRMLDNALRETEKKLEETRRKCEAQEMEMKDVRGHVRNLLDENKALKLDLNNYEMREKQLKDAMKNGAFDSLTKEDRDQFAFLREPLSRTYSKRIAEKNANYNFIAEEEEEDSEVIDYDQTGDSLSGDEGSQVIQLRNGREYRRSSSMGPRRRSHSANPSATAAKRSRSRLMQPPIEEEPQEGTPPKRSRDQEVTTTTTTTTTITSAAQQPMTSTRVHRSVTRRSLSCDSIPAVKPLPSSYGMHTPFTKSTLDLRASRTPAACWTTSLGSTISQRRHSFEDAGIRVSVTKCDACLGTITPFSGRSKCKDCHQEVHKACAARLHVPCIPRQKNCATPKSASRNNPKREYRLQDFCTSSKPMIPYPVIHCVVAIEKRGLHFEGLYRVPGQNRVVAAVLNELRSSRAIPNLDVHDVEVVTETLKKFLRELRDPLVPRTSREEFIVAAQQYSTNAEKGRLALNKAICELPQPNRDTLSYLFLHWRRVTCVSDMNKMPQENMARVLAPCVMGPPMHRLEQLQAAGQDVSNCERTLLALFSFDDTYWQRFLSAVPDSIESARIDRSPAAFDRSILGPVSVSPATPLISRSKRAPHHTHLLGPLHD